MNKFRRVTLGDREILEGLILSLEPCSCEMNFLNIYTWENAYDTHWCIWDGFPVIWFQKLDLVLFPGGNDPQKMPPPELLKQIADTMKQAGYSITFNQVPETYLSLHPEAAEYFTAEPMAEEFGEYLYSVKDLVELRGGKLAKKKNLISQFKRRYPDHQIKPYSPDQAQLCRELCRKWTSGHELNETIWEEEDALERSFVSSGALGMEGICLYVGDTLAAFSFWTRLDSKTCDEHYEKADPSFKGGAQMVNQASMIVM